jgi:ATP-binding cassette subfamily B multidrug efflux pump
MGQRVAYDLRNRIFSHLQSLPPVFFDRANTGDIMSRATPDVEGVRMFINWSLSSFLEMTFLFAAALVLMSLMSWQLTLLASAMFPMLGYAVMRFRRRLRPRYLAVQEQYGRMTTALQENLAGLRLRKRTGGRRRRPSAFGRSTRNCSGARWPRRGNAPSICRRFSAWAPPPAV